MFQTHCYAERLEAPGIEPGTSGSAARNSDRFSNIQESFKYPSPISKSITLGKCVFINVLYGIVNSVISNSFVSLTLTL
jgi:hypothetical protein